MDYRGVEINEKARNFSASKFNLDIISPEMLSSQPAESYDCITLWHVLEHFHNPYSYTREIKRLLKPEWDMCHCLTQLQVVRRKLLWNLLGSL
jgi:2-polyprenyl-3-methyl-5-hydroxy-6-metoxy-1,4-benzoquinol methylase